QPRARRGRRGDDHRDRGAGQHDRRGQGRRPAGELEPRLAHSSGELPAARRHRLRPETRRGRRPGRRRRQVDPQSRLSAGRPHLGQTAPESAIRGYLFATARSALGGFWSTRLGLSEAELHEDLALALPTSPPSEDGTETVQQILAQLSDNYRRVLELRFLHGYSLKEVAAEMN